MTSLSSQHVLLTGGSGGLGRAVGQALSDLGATIHAPSRVEMDATSGIEVARYVDSLAPITPTIVVCAHAAPVTPSLAREMDSFDFWETLGVDIGGTWQVFRDVARRLIDARMPGRMIAFSSIRARWPRAGQAAYAAAKSGVEGLVRALAVEWGMFGIAVNAIAPGAALTPRTRANIRAGVVSERELVERTPAGGLVSPEAVARMVACLCLTDTLSVTGQVIAVDGGWSVQG